MANSGFRNSLDDLYRAERERREIFATLGDPVRELKDALRQSDILRNGAVVADLQRALAASDIIRSQAAQTALAFARQQSAIEAIRSATDFKRQAIDWAREIAPILPGLSSAIARQAKVFEGLQRADWQQNVQTLATTAREMMPAMQALSRATAEWARLDLMTLRASAVDGSSPQTTVELVHEADAAERAMAAIADATEVDAVTDGLIRLFVALEGMVSRLGANTIAGLKTMGLAELFNLAMSIVTAWNLAVADAPATKADVAEASAQLTELQAKLGEATALARSADAAWLADLPRGVI